MSNIFNFHCGPQSQNIGWPGWMPSTPTYVPSAAPPPYDRQHIIHTAQTVSEQYVHDMLNFWSSVAKEQQAQAQAQQQTQAAAQQQTQATQQAAQPLAEQQQHQISAKIPSPLHQPEVEAAEALLSASHGNDKQQQHLPTAQAQAQAEAYVSSPSPSEEQQHQQQTPQQQQQTPFEADLQQSLDDLMEEEEQPLPPLSPLSEAEEEQGTGRITNPRIEDVLQSSYKLQNLYVKLLARKNSTSEVRLICDAAIQMYRKEEIELSYSQCRELGRQLLELFPHEADFWCRREGSNCIYNRIRTVSRTPEQKERESEKKRKQREEAKRSSATSATTSDWDPGTLQDRPLS